MVSDGEKVMTLWVFKVETLPCHPSEATHAAGSVSHIYTKGDSLSSLCDGGVPGLAPGACWRWGLRGIGPALAGNVGAS